MPNKTRKKPSKRKTNYGKRTWAILEAAAILGAKKSAQGLSSLIDTSLAILANPYGASYSQIGHSAEKFAKLREDEKALNRMRVEEENRLKESIKRLKEDAILGEDSSKGKKGIRYYLTKKGEARKEKLQRQQELLFLRVRKYKKEKTRQTLLIIFDIPERWRAKRDWLRKTLFHLGFNIVQKSVWVGETKIPKALLDDLIELKLFPEYIKIFTVRKKGNICS